MNKKRQRCELWQKSRVSGWAGGIQDFKLGGAHLKKLHRAEGGALKKIAPSVNIFLFTLKLDFDVA
jgi:hypothetical protein